MAAVFSAHLTRTEIGAADLLISDGLIVMDEDGPGEPGIIWRRQRATSPFVDGSVLVGKTRDLGSRSITFQCLGDDTVSALNRAEYLCQALRQTTYELHVTIDGQHRAWTCEAADYSVNLTGSDLRGGLVTVKATIPTQPVPIAGSF